MLSLLKLFLLIILILAKLIKYSINPLTIEESMHVKFEEYDAFVKNVVEIDTLGEDMEKVSLEDSPTQEDKQKLNGEVQEDEVELSQPLPKDWRYATSHPKDLIIGDVSKGVITHSKLHNICGHFAFISHIEPKNILEAKGDSYWLLTMQESSINLSPVKFGNLFLDHMIDQSLVLNRFL